MAVNSRTFYGGRAQSRARLSTTVSTFGGRRVRSVRPRRSLNRHNNIKLVPERNWG